MISYSTLWSGRFGGKVIGFVTTLAGDSRTKVIAFGTTLPKKCGQGVNRGKHYFLFEMVTCFYTGEFWEWTQVTIIMGAAPSCWYSVHAFVPPFTWHWRCYFVVSWLVMQCKPPFVWFTVHDQWLHPSHQALHFIAATCPLQHWNAVRVCRVGLIGAKWTASRADVACRNGPNAWRGLPQTQTQTHTHKRKPRHLFSTREKLCS